MATFYIFGERAINGTGSFADPFNAPPTITSNNEYLFAAGIEYHNASDTAINVPVNATGVTIGAYDPATGERIPLGGPKAIIRSGSQFVVRFNTNAHNGVVENLDISNLASVANAKGIYIGNSTSLVVNNTTVRACDVHDLKGTSAVDGIKYNGSNTRIEFSRIWGIPTDAVFGYGLGTTVVYNDIWDVDLQNNQGDCIQIVGDATLGCSNAFVAWNRLRNSYGNKQCVVIQDTTGGSSGGLVLGNIMIQATGGANQALYLDCPGARAIGNDISGGFYNIFVASNGVTLLANACRDAANNGLNLKTGNTGLVARNNTVLRAGGIGVNMGTADATSEARNNLVAYCGTAVQRNAGATATHNAVWGNGANGSPGSSVLTDDPLILADGRPLPGSPLLTGGADLGYRRDIRGYLSRKHIGAFGAARLVRP